MRLLAPICAILFSFSANIVTGAENDSFRQVLITEYGGPEVLELTVSSALPQPGPGEVRIRVLAASASFTDVMVRKGLYGIDRDPPYPPGYDLVGIVDALGEGVDQVQPGQRVADLTVWGAYSDYVVRPASGLVPVPDELPSDKAVVLVLSYLTAYQMLFRVANVEPEQTALIHGASGAVGTALAQLGRVAGLKMYGTASTRKLDYVRDLGVTAIDYSTEDFVERIMQDTGGAGVDVVFDAVGVDNFKRSYSVLAPGGTLVTYGLYLATREGDSMAGLGWEFLKMLWQQKLWDWFPSEGRKADFYSITDYRAEHPDWFRDDLSSLFELAVEGNIEPQIWRVMPLEQAAQAHVLIETGKVSGKIVLELSPDPVTPD